jgi:hypothetical protein
MPPGHGADCFIVVNGPEDGSEFAVVRSPFYIGADPACSVHLRLDQTVDEAHALVSVVSDGYRVRRLGSGFVAVNGKPAGYFRSRVLRAGGALQVGNTLIALRAGAEGLARRSRGVMTQNDAVWALRQMAGGSYRGFRGALRFLLRTAGRLLGSWMGIFAILILLYVFVDPFRGWLNGVIRAVYSRLLGSFLGALGG